MNSDALMVLIHCWKCNGYDNDYGISIYTYIPIYIYAYIM